MEVEKESFSYEFSSFLRAKLYGQDVGGCTSYRYCSFGTN